jgi:hypothetical protein
MRSLSALARVFCCLLMSSLVASVEYSVDCLQFYASVAAHVDCGGQCPAMQSARDCARSGLVHKMLVYEDAVAVRNTSVVYDLRDPRELSRLLVFASIGRHFTLQPGVKTPYFTWDARAGTLALKQPSCEYQRSLYAFILIVTLVFVLVSVAMQATVGASAARPYPKDTGKSDAAVSFRVNTTEQR